MKVTKDKTDNIIAGSYDKKGEFTAMEGGASHSVSKGILNATDKTTDLSKTGVSVPGGKQEEGVDMMKFISFNCYKELTGWGYNNNKGQHGLEIAPWDMNTFSRAYSDEYSKSGAFDKMGVRTFHVHTHPGTREGLGGNGYPSGTDLTGKHKSIPSSYYILSRKHGLTQYFPGKGSDATIRPLQRKTPQSLQKYIK